MDAHRYLMRQRRRLALLVAASALTLTAAPRIVTAQGSRADRDSLSVLRQEWLAVRDSIHRLRVRAETNRKQGLLAPLTDTISVDGVRIFTSLAHREAADSAFRAAAAFVNARFGRSLATMLGDSVAFVGPALREQRAIGLGWLRTPTGIGFGDPAAPRAHYAIEFRTADVDAMTARILYQTSVRTHARADRAFRGWVATAVPLQPFSAEDLQEDRRIIVGAGALGRDCLTGRVARCRDVVFDTTGASIAVRGAIRASVIQLAIDLGGSGAWERLMTDTLAPMSQRLAAAAGVSSDTLVARWGSALRVTRNDVSFSDLAWVVVVLGGSLAVARRRAA